MIYLHLVSLVGVVVEELPSWLDIDKDRRSVS